MYPSHSNSLISWKLQKTSCSCSVHESTLDIVINIFEMIDSLKKFNKSSSYDKSQFENDSYKNDVSIKLFDIMTNYRNDYLNIPKEENFNNVSRLLVVIFLIFYFIFNC